MAEHASTSSVDSAVNWVLANRLKAIGYTWLTGVGGSLVSARRRGSACCQPSPRHRRLAGTHTHPTSSQTQAYQWTRPIPTSLKLIHSRVYAQAITLGALGCVAAMELYAQSSEEQRLKAQEE